MSYTLAFDPGKHVIGWASFVDDDLIRCGLHSPDHLATMAAPPEARILVEYQQIYTRGKSRTRNPADVLSVTIVAGRIVQALRPTRSETVELILPHAWKGGVDGDVMTRRIVSMLTPKECEILRATKVQKSLLHNVIDAIGLGLWSVGRLGRMAKKNARSKSRSENDEAREAGSPSPPA